MSDTGPAFDPDGCVFIGTFIKDAGGTDEARLSLRKQLASGAKTAVMRDAGGRLWSVPAHRWNADECMTWLRTSRAKLTITEWRVSYAPEKPVPTDWIFIEDSERGQVNALPVSDRTGSPGAPSSSHLVEMELARRLSIGAKESSLAKQAASLSKWLKETHPGLRQMTPGTIENTIRDAWRGGPRK